jgi:hypothetical protein
MIFVTCLSQLIFGVEKAMARPEIKVQVGAGDWSAFGKDLWPGGPVGN